MCGIAGYCGLEQNKNILKNMNDEMSHRGPDGEGFYCIGKVGLAHRRLAILDRAHGDQPMYSEDKKIVVIYNGEIYNYKALRSELEDKGRVFKTNSDTEVILHAYAVWGEDCFDKFNGMFAIALNDSLKNKFYLVRDHFGIKPLYYVNLGTVKSPKIVFASEIKPLFASGLVDKKPNDRTIYRYLKFRIHDDNEETFFDSVLRLGSGEMMIIDSKGLEIKPFTNLKSQLKSLATNNEPYSDEKTLEYKDRLIEAVKLRLQSEVPVGTSLSGGLDSSTVAVIINQLMKNDAAGHEVESVGAKQNTFSAVFPNAENNEERYVDDVLESVSRVSGHKIEPSADQFIKDLGDFIKTQEEPIISTGPYAQYSVMKYAKDYVTVLLDGQGADEIMAGYTPYYFVYLRQLKANGQWFKFAKESLLASDVIFRLLRFRLKDKLLFKEKVSIEQLMSGSFKKQFNKEKFAINNHNLKQRLIEDIFYNSLPSLLRYEDKNTMRFSIEGRVPFIDKELMQFVFGLSDEAIIKNSWNKRILRDSMKGLLPDAVRLRRNKIGFTTPEGEWFLRLKNRFYAIFMSMEFSNRPYFNQPEVAKAFEGFISGTNNSNSLLFWRILNVELWLREFIDDKVPEVVTRPKGDLEANPDKKIDIKVGQDSYMRFPIITHQISADDSINDTILPYVKNFFDKLSDDKKMSQKLTNSPWQLFVSEKIIALMQGRSYFIWDIVPGWWAKQLSRFVTKTPYGIGLGSPFTMQLAIKQVGLPKIIYASIGGVIGKMVGKRGMFYNLVGEDIRAIDGPTEYSVYPSNVSAKLAPENPSGVAKSLEKAIRQNVDKKHVKNFEGVVVIDSNDLGRNVLGKSVQDDNKLLESIFADNPLGQGEEKTPLAVVFKA